MLAGLSDSRASAVIVDLSYSEYLNAFDALENILRGNGQWFNPHPWWLTFLPDSAAESLAAEILDQVTRDGVGPFGQVTYYPMTTGAFRTPLLRIPGGSVIFPFNIVRLPAANDQATIDQMVAQNRTFYVTANPLPSGKRRTATSSPSAGLTVAFAPLVRTTRPCASSLARSRTL